MFVSMDDSKVQVKFTLFTASSHKIKVSETQFQFIYTPVDLKKADISLSPVHICCAERVLWC
jgi:Cu/Ag efflux protein CusF